MSKSTAVPAWVPIDKRIVHTFKEIKGPFPKCAALISYSLDVNCGVVRSASAYSRMWSWSRSRVNRFIKSLEQSEQLADSLRTGSGHPISVIDLSSRGQADTKRTLGEQVADTKYKEQEREREKEEYVEKQTSQPQIPYSKIVSFLNEKTGSKYNPKTQATRRMIKARFNEGFVFEDFQAVISHKTDEWISDEKMLQYLRPQTLFGTKFETYRQSAGEYNGKQTSTTPLWVHPDLREEQNVT